MPLIKVWDHTRKRKKIGFMRTLEDVKNFGQKELGYENNNSVTIVFEKDGTEIDSEDIFQCLISENFFPENVLMLLPKNFIWSAESAQQDALTQQRSVGSVVVSGSTNSENIQQETQICNINDDTNDDTIENLKGFKIPWDKLDDSFIEACECGKSPTPSDRRQAIRHIISSVQRVDTHPPRSFIKRLAKEAVEKYPKSLSDSVGAKCYEQLFEQLENRLYHCHRSNKQNLKTTVVEKNKGSKRIRDEHGCINWQPKEFSSGETETSQKEKREWLKAEMVKNSPEELVTNEMASTFVLQRLDINSKKFSIERIYNEWPYLFQRKCFLQHAGELLAIDLENKWRQELEQKVPVLLNYFKTLKDRSVCFGRLKETITEVENNVGFEKSRVAEECSLLLLLLKYFGEDESLLIQYFEKTTLQEDVLHKTSEKTNLPVIAVLGSCALSDPDSYLCVGGKKIGEKTNFKNQVLLLFICYYVFNFHYPGGASATLEFIQRGILKIDPVFSGHKRSGKRKRTTVHPKVLSLLNNICTINSSWFNN